MWEINPLVGLSDLNFLTPREIVRSSFKENFRSLSKGRNPEFEDADSYDHLGIRLDYDESGLLEFIEVFKPCNSTYSGIAFIDRNIDNVLDDMESLGYEAEWNSSGSGCIFPELGFGLYVPLEHTVEAVSVFRAGLYDDLNIWCL